MQQVHITYAGWEEKGEEPSKKTIAKGSLFLFKYRARITFMEPKNRFQGINSASIYSLAGRYDNPIPNLFLALVDCLKIPAQYIPLTVGEC